MVWQARLVKRKVSSEIILDLLNFITLNWLKLYYTCHAQHIECAPFS